MKKKSNLIVTSSQILTDGIRGANVPPLARGAHRHVGITILGEVEQAIEPPIGLVGGFLSNALNVEHTSQFSVVGNIVNDRRSRTRDGDNGSSIIRNNSRPLVEDRALVQILGREVAARLLVEVLDETAIPDGLVERLVHALGPINGGDFNGPSGDITAGGTGLDQLSTVNNETLSAGKVGVLAVGDIVTHVVGGGATSVERGDIRVRDHGDSGLGTLLSPGGSVGVPSRVLPVESFNLIDLFGRREKRSNGRRAKKKKKKKKNNIVLEEWKKRKKKKRLGNKQTTTKKGK